MTEVNILDRLPIGVMSVRAGAIAFMNYTLRSLFAGTFASLAELADAFPGTAGLADALARSEPVWVSIGDAVFYVDVTGHGQDDELVVFVPLNYMDPKDPQLRELRELYTDFQEIFHNCFDGIYVADGSGRSLWLNEGFERAYGLEARDFIGRDVRELERLGHMKPMITWKVITTKQRQSAVQRTKAGKSVLATGIPLLDERGNVRKVIINSRDLTELVALQQRLSEAEADLARTRSELAQLRLEAGRVDQVTWSSAAMQEVVDLGLRLARVDTTLLIQGESGVGKDVIARLIHTEGTRRDGPFVKINCGAIPTELLESELFGYESGAFTGARKEGKAGLFEVANGGTIFLDEIGEMPAPLQVKLLQVIQDRTFTRLGSTRTVKVDLRLIAATNRDLRSMVRERTFREDLFYRLSVVPIDIPPLRERPEDIAPLTQRFLQEINERYGFTRHFSGAVMDRLLRYAWPGNVRELRNVVERLAVTAREDEIGLETLPSDLLVENIRHVPSNKPLKAAARSHEVETVQATVERLGSIGRAAVHLGVSESTVKRRLREGRKPPSD
ncbi:RNA polymerase subunit sigma-54 [Dyella flava]|uniref:Sigma 54-interacting transcriptional regulator n=2 Tax=Dyella flava TaxID=1920170 RepID=A0ABS2JZS2_9GAMM|nr:sigma 54-interacting transcriptional regulator [Dyella flava]GLQ50047.1 RNA polymerase subunit sigma-54 [Dyella flava]